MFPQWLLLIVFTLVAVGIFLYFLPSIPWVDADIKLAIRIIILICTAFWLMYILYNVLSGGGGGEGVEVHKGHRWHLFGN